MSENICLELVKIDKNNVEKIEKINLGFRICTGAVEDKFYKAIAKIKVSDTQTKLAGVAMKYIDTDNTDNDQFENQSQLAIMKAIKAGELSIDVISEMNNPTINAEEKKSTRSAKIEAIKACSYPTDTKYFKEFNDNKANTDFWENITSKSIDEVVTFFRKSNSL